MTKLYLSGPAGGSDRYSAEEAARTTHRLFSLHGSYVNAVMAWIEKAKTYSYRPETILLDSGAFTAWNKGHKTSVQEVIAAYSAFLNASQGMFKEIWGINLDVIPGEAGRDPTQEEIAQAVVESDENLKILQDIFGDMILPVFHQGESEERLDIVVAQAEYICISPRNDLHEMQRVRWAQEVHTHTGPKQTHGLATTGSIMLTIPWFSVDSATFRHIAAYGRLLFYIDDALYNIPVTRDSDKHKDMDQHYDTLNPYLRYKCEQEINNDIFSHEELQAYFGARALFNINQLKKFTADRKQTNISQYNIFGI